MSLERSHPVWTRLRAEALREAEAVPPLAASLTETAAAEGPVDGLATLLGRLLPSLWLEPGMAAFLARDVLLRHPVAVEAALADLERITMLNFEPGGLLGTWIGGRGFHMLLSHRVAHALWQERQHSLAMAWKTGAALLGADIHPAARIGRGIFLDHGAGVVIGETAVIEDEVCLWHGVTLGSTLMQDGERHPRIRRGAVLGAGATVLGAIEVGMGAVVASGSVVLDPVASHSTVAGNPARPKPRHRHPYDFAARETAAPS
ncbi:serine O-acetyltransferase [Roseomonas mucosa]|uniref:serine O-acetyltransferase n=1 Tax=Roseomonas mucosa TaxID=207340 RepID=UPI00384E8670